ncbi:MAG: PLD nuclease N-terminal domain-containing protein [Saccharofermentanales bacterium]
MTTSAPDINNILSTLKTILPLLIPVLIIQYSLMIYSLIKLIKSESEPKYLPRWAWALIIIFVNLIGSVLYLVIGRKDE